MIQVQNKKLCSGCAACYNSCPFQAISMQEDNEGFLYPIVDSRKCIECKKCEEICPCINGKIKTEEELSLCYAGYNRTHQTRNSSPSGGILALAAEKVLYMGVIVFGASFDETFTVYHTSVENTVDLQKLIGSKYLQSRVGSVYQDVKKQLSIGRIVLFAGTTCQVAGLKAFLEKPYSNLMCMDFICLGVPSPKVWRDYLSTYFKNYEIERINFKDKTNGWHTFSLHIKGKYSEFIKKGKLTEFFSGYFRGLYSRPSCSQCNFKVQERISDITVADCWGYTYIAPELDDNKGLSSIVIHSKAGHKLFESIKDNLVYKKADISDVKKYNDNYYTARPMGKQREAFWEDYGKIPMNQLFKKYCTLEQENSFPLFILKAKRKIIRFMMGRRG